MLCCEGRSLGDKTHFLPRRDQGAYAANSSGTARHCCTSLCERKLLYMQTRGTSGWMFSFTAKSMMK